MPFLENVHKYFSQMQAGKELPRFVQRFALIKNPIKCMITFVSSGCMAAHLQHQFWHTFLYYKHKAPLMTNSPTDTEAHLKGSIKVTLANNLNLEDFCSQYIPDYNRDRFEALAIRLFVGDETLITVYALDKIRQEDSSASREKIPVKKFKLTGVPITAVFNYCSAFNCTLDTGMYDIEDLEVVNK